MFRVVFLLHRGKGDKCFFVKCYILFVFVKTKHFFKYLNMAKQFNMLKLQVGFLKKKKCKHCGSVFVLFVNICFVCAPRPSRTGHTDSTQHIQNINLKILKLLFLDIHLVYVSSAETTQKAILSKPKPYFLYFI